MSARTQGAHHIGLTVPDIDAARHFFMDALGFTLVAENPDYPAVFVSDGVTMITLWRAEDPALATAFDRKTNIGLHHFALKVGSQSELNTLGQLLSDRDDVVVEFSPEPLGSSGLHHMMCRIPGNIRVEFIGV